MTQILFLILLLLLAACNKTKAKYSEQKLEPISFSNATPERGYCLTATTVINEVQKAIAESSKDKDIVLEGSTKGPCPDSLKVLNVDAKLIKKCDSYQDKTEDGSTTYQWYLYDKHVVDGNVEPMNPAALEEMCKNLNP